MDLILKCKGIEIEEYFIPPFTLYAGEVVRFWIQIVPKNANKSGYEISQILRKILTSKKEQEGLEINHHIPFAESILEKNILSTIFPLTVKKYLQKKRKLNLTQIQDILQELNLNSKDKIGYLDFTTRKSLSISSLFKKCDCISFDYYGLDPLGTDKIDNLIMKAIKAGKSAIGFDNLYFFEEERSNTLMKDIKVRPKGKQNN